MIEKKPDVFSYNSDLENKWKFDTKKVFKYANKRDGEKNGTKGFLYDLEKYSYEEYTQLIDAELKSVKQDNETTKGALDTLMQVVMMGTPVRVQANDEPTPALMAVEGIDNTKQKGADNVMAAYIAKRVIDLEAQQEGAGKAYYKLYLSSALWGTYKEDVDFILADLGHSDLIVDLSEA